MVGGMWLDFRGVQSVCQGKTTRGLCRDRADEDQRTNPWRGPTSINTTIVDELGATTGQ